MKGGKNKIKKLITAIGTNELNKKIKERDFFEVIGNDIPYQDGVLDVLKGNFEIDILILNETLSGEYKINNFIHEIKKINPYLEIIFFMKKENDELKNFLIINGISKIYIDGSNSLDEILNGICIINNEKDLNLEIEKLKKMINEKKDNNYKNKKTEKIKKFKISKTIAISGNYGVGKSIFTARLAKVADKINLNTIIIDFDIINNSINTLFNISKYKKKYIIYEKIEQCILKINDNISIFYGVDILFNENNKISFEKVKELFDKLKDKYDLILIDTSSEINLKYIKTILVNVEKIIFLIEPNLIELKKSKELLEIYIEDWEISKNKFNIVLNKVNINSIDSTIINNIFNKIKIIGKIKMSKNYTNFANNIKSNINDFKEYNYILKKIG